jgi:hypothetical protein
MNRLRKNIQKQFHLEWPQKNKIPRNEFNKGVKAIYNENYKP